MAGVQGTSADAAAGRQGGSSPSVRKKPSEEEIVRQLRAPPP